MKKLILISICLFLCNTQVLSTTNNFFFKQDPKSNTKISNFDKKKNKKKKKLEENEMLDKKISISDENQPINKSKVKKGK